MIRNYFKIAFRNLWRNKGFSLINILGLAIGIATCLIIMLFVNNELSYDRYNKKADRMVRVFFKIDIQDTKLKESTVMPPVAQTLKADYPEVEEATRLRDFGMPKLMNQNKTFKDDALAFVDSNFFSVFTLPLLEGDARTALIEPNSVVITKAVANKFFGNQDAMGKVISFKDGEFPPCKVTGIIDQVPPNSHFHFDLFVSMSGYPEAGEPSWMRSNFYTYLVLQKGYEYKKLEAKLPELVDKYIGPQMQPAMGMTLAQFREKGNTLSFHLQPLTDIHLHSDFANDLSQPGDIRYVYIFSAIALFMLLIACINFMNLSTAAASKRAREVGIRKVLGSRKPELIRQFLFETIVITALALALALVFSYLALPVFNYLADQKLSLQLSEHPFLVPESVLLVLVIGVLAGSYPAFYLSSFKPAEVLKSKLTSGGKSFGLRSSLVVFQFFISILLIVSTMVVYNQLYYIQHKNLGYDKEKVLVLQDTWVLGKNLDVFRQFVQNDLRVKSVSSSGYLPVGKTDNNAAFVSPGENSRQLVKIFRYDVDENYIPTLGMKLLEGRNFSRQFGSDSNNVIINEAAVIAFGWKKGTAVGKTITRTNNAGIKEVFPVIGVLKDFHFRSLHEHVTPLLMFFTPNQGNLIVKLRSTKDATALISLLEKRWKELGAEDPLTYSFLDDRYKNSYEAEQKTGLILGIFAALTIFVACLGLFGLAKFTASQRTKEIGIRKVLGASVAQVTGMLSKEFLVLVLISCILAFPVAWWAMNKWLQDFAYRINISWWIFALAGVTIILIALFTVSFQAIKAAMANPVKSLRTE
jgi:putative ABC transport system permease protein